MKLWLSYSIHINKLATDCLTHFSLLNVCAFNLHLRWCYNKAKNISLLQHYRFLAKLSGIILSKEADCGCSWLLSSYIV